MTRQIVQVVFGGVRIAAARPSSCSDERIEGEHTVLCDWSSCIWLCSTTAFACSRAAWADCTCALGEKDLRALLFDGLLPCSDGGPGLFHLIYGDELLGQQRLDTVIVVGRVEQFGVGAVECRLSVGNICFGFVHRSCGTVDVRSGAVGVCAGRSYGAYLGGNGSALVADLPLERAEVRSGPLERILIGAGVDLKEQLALFDESVVLDRERRVMGPSTCGAMPMKLAKTSASSVRGYRLVSVITSSPVINAPATIAMLTILPTRRDMGGGSFSGIASPFRIS